MSALKHAILHSLLRKENLCCLCFNIVQSELVHLDDEAKIADSSNIKLSEMLNIILGCDITENLPSQTICNDCVVSAMHSYTFIKNCNENNENLQLAIDNLDNCLESSIGSIDSCNSLFVSLDSSLAAQVYYDYKQPVTSLSSALVRYNAVSSDVCNGKYYIESSPRKQPDPWIAPKLKYESDDDYDNFSITDFTIKSGTKKAQKMEFLPDHVMIHKKSTNKKPICRGCEKTFENVNMLRMHYMRVHAPKDIECPKCDRTFSANKLLEIHLSLSHANAVCFECGKTFTNIASLKKHELSHKSTKYVCQNCHRVYKTLRNLKDHVQNGVCERGGRASRKVENTGQYICDVCGARLSSKNTVRSHMITLHGFGSNENVHTCTWCNKRFQAASSLKRHIVKHTGERRFQCDLCDEKFVTKPALVYHTRLHTGEKPYGCDYCEESFVSSSRRMEHLRLKHWEPSLACRLCPKIFKCGAGRRKHERRHFTTTSKLYIPKNQRPEGIKEPDALPSRKVENTGQYTCDICGARFSSKNAVHSHMITLHGFGSDENVHTCTWCNKRFQAASSLKSHIVKHTGERRFQCDLCDEKFVTQQALVNHTRLHTGEKPYGCDYCEESFVSSSRRMEHVRLKHWEPSLPCRLCPMIFKSAAGRRKHEPRHFTTTSKLYIPKNQRPEGIKEPDALPSSLERADVSMNVGTLPQLASLTSRRIKGLKASRNLMLCHQVENTGQYICDVCGARFSSKKAVHSHMITLHGLGSDENVHTCTWCNKRFQAASSLKSHIVKHTGERRFQCDVCDKKFVTKPALVNHTRLHTGEKPYGCDYCEESFVSSSRRMEHLRLKHWEPSLPCRLCPMIFKSGAGRRKHERRHFTTTSKLYISKNQRPEGIKEPREMPAPVMRKKRRPVLKMDILEH